MKYNTEERTGVYSVAKIFTEELKWIFREQPINDFGIDAFLEITKFKIPTGKLFGVQIKSGKSFFKEVKDDHFVFRGSRRHLAYWLNYSIPVVLIIYDKDSNLAYWQEVSSSTIGLTAKHFKLQISKKNILNYSSSKKLTGIAYFKNKYEYKLWQLKTSRNEINLLLNKELFLYVEIDYCSKHEKYITLIVTDKDTNNHIELIYDYGDENPNRFEYGFIISKGGSLDEAIKDTIPWADLLLDGSHFTDNLLIESISLEILSYEQEDFCQDIVELKNANDLFGLACYLADGYCFKLQLKANELAFAFLKIDLFLDKELSVKQRMFF